MKTFYKIEQGRAQVGQGTFVPESFIEYTMGQEPQELQEALQKEQKEQEEQALKLEQSKARDETMLAGATYNLNNEDYQISLTKEDGDGLAQVKTAFELGLTQTTIHFSNGTKLQISSTEFLAFALWFVNKRNEFFI